MGRIDIQRGGEFGVCPRHVAFFPPAAAKGETGVGRSRVHGAGLLETRARGRWVAGDRQRPAKRQHRARRVGVGAKRGFKNLDGVVGTKDLDQGHAVLYLQRPIARIDRCGPFEVRDGGGMLFEPR